MNAVDELTCEALDRNANITSAAREAVRRADGVHLAGYPHGMTAALLRRAGLVAGSPTALTPLGRRLWRLITRGLPARLNAGHVEALRRLREHNATLPPGVYRPESRDRPRSVSAALCRELCRRGYLEDVGLVTGPLYALTRAGDAVLAAVDGVD